MYKKLSLIALLAPLAALAQNVGVGTRTPTTRLHVVDSVNNVQLKVESVPLGSDANISLQAGNNLFSFLQLSKYAPGSLGSISGVSKDNLSAITTGGNGGPLLLNTGDGLSPLLFAAGSSEHMRITAAGRVGIGTTAPATANKLHVHDGDPASDVSIGITNAITTDAPLRGARFRMIGSDLIINNYETTGRLALSTNFNQRLVISGSGNIGINKLNPNYLLDIAQTANNSNGVNLVVSNGLTNTTGIRINNPNNFNPPNNYSVGLHATAGSGVSLGITPTATYGLIGESLNQSDGFGVLGISHSPSAQFFQAAVVGINLSTEAAVYGIIGKSSGSSGAGTVGFTTNATAGLLGYANFNSTGPAIKSTSLPTSAQIGLELENGAIKVSGANRTAFQHVATAANTFLNETVIPNTGFANNANDLLIVTPFWDGVYINSAIGVYFDTGSWRIFRQDLQPMPVNAKFNVLVIKQ
jgi:hypothetical protein